MGLVMKKLFWSFPQHGVQGCRKQGCQILLLEATLHNQILLLEAILHNPCSASDK